MATQSTAQAHWEGSLTEGAGSVDLVTSGVAHFDLKWAKRAEAGAGTTNPEELIAAAHASCFAMQLSHFLAENGTPATKLDATATIELDMSGGGATIKSSTIELIGTVPGIDDAKFKELADKAKAGCPVSRALGAIEVNLNARLG